MSIRDISAAFATAAWISLIPGALADLVVNPCASGAGTPDHNGCGGCDTTQATTATAWNTPADFKSIIIDSAVNPNGGSGWDIWWDIPRPDPGCRVLIIEPFITQEGSVVPGVGGNVIVSASHEGCYYGHVGSRGVDVKFCCGDGDCGTAGAISGQPGLKRSLSKPPSRIMRDVVDDAGLAKRKPADVRTSTRLEKLREVFTRSLLDARCFIQDCDQPPPPPPPPVYSCTKPSPVGGTFSKAGPVFSYDHGWSHDQSVALSNSFSDSSGTTATTTNTLTYGVMPGPYFLYSLVPA